jgi:hypothetical protein
MSLTIRDSQYALSAADSALDCAKYWGKAYQLGADDPTARPFGYYDYNDPANPVFTPGADPFPWPGGVAMCGSVSINSPDLHLQQSVGGNDESRFTAEFDDSAIPGGKKLCAKVTVKYGPNGRGASIPGAEVTADGYSVSCPDLANNSIRTVQRTLITSF